MGGRVKGGTPRVGSHPHVRNPKNTLIIAHGFSFTVVLVR